MRDIETISGAERGAAFVIVTILTIISIGLIGAHFTTSMAKVRHVEQQVAEMAAFNAAEAGLSMSVERVWVVYRSASPKDRFDAVKTFLGIVDEEEEPPTVPPPDIDQDGVEEGGNEESPGTCPELTPLIPERKLNTTRLRTFFRDVRVKDGVYIDIEFVSVGENDRASRTLTAVVRYGNKTSRVFDSAYFINNFGWLWGSTITVNGSVRANGDFSVKSATVNGDIFAAENADLGAPGLVEGASNHKTIDQYNSTYGTNARPTNPSAEPEDLNGNGLLDPGEDRNGNGRLDDFGNLDGYDGESERFEKEKPIEMPYLGDLSAYRQMAVDNNGTISQGGTVLVDAVYGDDAGESGNIAIVGTEENPIVISGPVVIESDVVLKGYITGRGTIYAGRNVHFIGNVKYVNPPSWPKPLENPEEIAAQNQSRDLVGYCAKGSIIMGNYTSSTWRSNTRNYQRPPFTQSYVVDPTDEGIGYVSYHDSEGRPVFDGNYTDYDGGKKAKNWPDNGELTSRRYYESSFADKYIKSIADSGYVTRIDGVLYTNHLLSGRIGACTFNGTLVARDEAIIYSTKIMMNYDVRTRFTNYEFLENFLPREPMRKILYFREGL